MKSDVIIASPVGLRMKIGAKEDKEVRDYDSDIGIAY